MKKAHQESSPSEELPSPPHATPSVVTEGGRGDFGSGKEEGSRMAK